MQILLAQTKLNVQKVATPRILQLFHAPHAQADLMLILLILLLAELLSPGIMLIQAD